LQAVEPGGEDAAFLDISEHLALLKLSQSLRDPHSGHVASPRHPPSLVAELE